MSLHRYFSRVSSESNTALSSPTTPAQHIPNLLDSGLGTVEHRVVTDAVIDLSDPTQQAQLQTRKEKAKSKCYTHYTDQQRAKIGKYALEHGNENARKHLMKYLPNLGESTIRSFKRQYKERLAVPGTASVTSTPTKPRGRPPLLLEHDTKLLHFLQCLRVRRGAINIHVVRAIGRALIDSNPSLAQLSRFEMPRSWVVSVYRRLGFVQRAGTTGRPPVSRELYAESRLMYLQDISEKMEKFSIPPELVFNADQTPSNYVPVGTMTMSKRGEKSVPVKGLSDKRNITLTFVVTLSGEFLPMQIIDQGKTDRSQPRGFKFPDGFSVTQNPKHWSNETETLNQVKEVIDPYIKATRKKLGLPDNQKALLVWDIFKARTTDKVTSELKRLNLEYTSVPANMTHFFQPLDLTSNRSAKEFMKKSLSLGMPVKLRSSWMMVNPSRRLKLICDFPPSSRGMHSGS